MRKNYLEPEMELLRFYLEDVVCSSLIEDLDESEVDSGDGMDIG